MATIILNQNETSTIANDGDIVRGRQEGAEAIRIESGVTDIETNAELERIDLPAFSSGDLSFQVTNNGLAISAGGNTIVTVPSLNQDLNLRLTDGNVTVSQTGAQQFTLTNPTDDTDTATIGTESTALAVGLGDDLVDNGGGDDPLLIEGTVNDDVITPADSADFTTSDANETIRGAEGNDSIDGGGGADTVEAGAGNDTLVGDPDDPTLDGGEGFDRLQTGAVSDSVFGSDSDDISLEPVTNVELIDTTNSEGDNQYDLSNLLLDSVTGGENTFGVLEDSLTFLVNNTNDEIDLGDVSSDKTIRVIANESSLSELDINNPGGVNVVELSLGDNAILDGGDFTVPSGPSFYIGTDADETITADVSDLNGEDTLAGTEGTDTLALSGTIPGEIPDGRVEFVSGIDVINLDDATVTGNLLLDQELVGQLVRGEPDVDEADTLTVASSNDITVDTQNVGGDDTIILSGSGRFNLANQRSGTSLQGNIVTIADVDGIGSLVGSNGNDTIDGGNSGDLIDLRPETDRTDQGNTLSGNNRVSAGEGDDSIAAGTGQDSLEGEAGEDRFMFGLDRTSEASRLNANDTIKGGADSDTVALVANTVIDGTSEFSNVEGVDVIELNGDADDDNDQFGIDSNMDGTPEFDLLDNNNASSDGFPDPVLNEVTIIDSLVESADSGPFTIDVSNDSVDNRGAVPGDVKAPFDLVDTGSVLNSADNINDILDDDSVDNNFINLFQLSASSNVSIEGGNAHDSVIFSDTSFEGQHTIDGGDGGRDFSVGSDLVLPVGNFAFNNAGPPADTPDVAVPVTSNGNRAELADSVANIDTLDFRANGSEPFEADLTDFNNIKGFEEIQLSTSTPGIGANFQIEIDDSLVRQLTQSVSTGAGGTTSGQNANLFISLDAIDSIGGTAQNQQIGPSSTLDLITNGLTDSLNTVTVLNPNGISVNATLGNRVNEVSADIITSAEIAEARGKPITQNYANAQVGVTVGNNLLGQGGSGTPATLQFQGTTDHSITTGDGDFKIFLEEGDQIGGDDTITSGSGDDSLVAGSGNDTFNRVGGDEGNDTIDGGSGFDIIQFRNFFLDGDSGVEVDLGGNTPFATGVDSLRNIEGVIGSRRPANDTIGGDDTLTGSDNANVISGLSGDDTIEGGAGADTIDGGTGTDTASYANAGSGVDVDLTANTATDGSGSTDELISIENIIGSEFGDTLEGGGNENSIEGGAGADSIRGLQGDDELVGGSDNDTIEGGAGADTIDGGGGTDTASYANAGNAVTVSLALEENTPQDDVGTVANGDVLLNVENLFGSAQGDTLTGSDGDNQLNGADGDDRLFGDDPATDPGGADTLIGGAGIDTLTGGAGSDIFRYNDPAEGGLNEEITDFDPVNDSDIIQLNDANFDTGEAQSGTSLFNAGENGNINTALITGGGLEGFITGGGSTPGVGNNLPTYLYGAQSGILAFDADGDGGAQTEAIARFGAPSDIQPDQGQTFNEALSESVFGSVEFVDVV